MFAKQTKVLKRKGSPKLKHISAYVGAFLLIVTLVALGYQPPRPIEGNLANASPLASVTTDDTLKPSSDDIVANAIAGDLSERANLPIAPNVAELSVTLAVKDELAQNDETTITKPQIVQPTAGSREIRSYTTKTGDNAQTVASQFGISATTLKWANSLTVDALDPGKQLVIPPVDGVVYTVKNGDTVDTIAARYNVDKDQIVAYNDLELGGLTVGNKIILAGGNLPENERPGYVAPRAAYASYSYAGNSARNNINASAGNRYSFGYCTWYVYERRAAAGRSIGSFWGNASNWASSALGSGLRVDHSPEPGSIMQNGGGAGHVAYVESVGDDGSVSVREMNYYAGGGGWNIISSRTISGGQAANYNFIH